MFLYCFWNWLDDTAPNFVFVDFFMHYFITFFWFCSMLNRKSDWGWTWGWRNYKRKWRNSKKKLEKRSVLSHAWTFMCFTNFPFSVLFASYATNIVVFYKLPLCFAYILCLNIVVFHQLTFFCFTHKYHLKFMVNI